MSRRTSLAAYCAIHDNGYLSRSRWQVYDCLFHNGPMTAGELTSMLQRPNEPHPSYHRRLHELEQLGVAFRGGTRACCVTGNTAEVWDVTDQLPFGSVVHAHKPTKAEVADALRELRQAHATLKEQTGAGFTKNLIDVLAWLRDKHS